jgi:hypothetical protein
MLLLLSVGPLTLAMNVHVDEINVAEVEEI